MKADRRGGNTAETGQATRERILDVAESLFAEKGPEAVSVRAIAAAAEVNIAAMNYHFGTKDRLFEQIFRRRVIPINDQRLAMLDEAITQAGPGRVLALETIFSALITPPLQFSHVASGSARAMVVMQFLAHAFSSGDEEAFLELYYDEVRTRFLSALQAAAPNMPIEEVVLRYNFVIGSIVYAMGGPTRLTRLPRGLAKPVISTPAVDVVIRQLVQFASAGFRQRRGEATVKRRVSVTRKAGSAFKA